MSHGLLLVLAVLLACACASEVPETTQGEDCPEFHKEYEQMLDCEFGIHKWVLDGCNRWKCRESPCVRVNCSSNEQCIIIKRDKPTDQGDWFSAFCGSDAACKPFEMECKKHCDFGIEKTRGADGCDRCKCKQNPCDTTSCAEGMRCILQASMPGAEESLFSAECETMVKAGACPADDTSPQYDTCPRECADDADCRGVGKCCRRGCSYLCLAPVHISSAFTSDMKAVVTGELNKPLYVGCKLHGNTPSVVSWLFGFTWLNNNTVYEMNENVLLIRNLAINNLGEYKCYADDVEGNPVSLGVVVQAYKPDGLFLENKYLVPRVTVAPRISTQPPTVKKAISTTSTSTTEAINTTFTVPVSTHVSTPLTTIKFGAKLRLTCEVDGFPEPDVHWTKDGVNIQADGRITITGSTGVSRLKVKRVTVADSGLYACHASNPYSSQSDTVQINVQQFMLPAKCTDNFKLANCNLIVSKKFCSHKYYSKWCCKSCVEAGQLNRQGVKSEPRPIVNIVR